MTLGLDSPFFVFFFVLLCLPVYYLFPRQRARAWGVLLFSASLLLFLDPLNSANLLCLGLFAFACRKLRQDAPSAASADFWKLLGVGGCVADVLLTRFVFHFTTSSPSYYSLVLIAFLLEEGAPAGDTVGRAAALASFYTVRAGPVLPLSRHARDLASPAAFDSLRGQRGFCRICRGVAKKAISNQLGEFLKIALAGGSYGGRLQSLTIALALTAQIYLDLSGYADLAIGYGTLLGVEVAENFRLPFLATSMADHWRRWHVTVTHWFRDYVFTPLCFSLPLRRLRPDYRLIAAVFLTMLAIGLWHAFTLGYVLWGTFNAACIVGGDFCGRRLKAVTFPGKTALAVLITFYLGVIARVLAQMPSPREAIFLLKAMHFATVPDYAPVSFRLLQLSPILAAIVVPHAADYLYDRIAQGRRPSLALTAYSLVCLILAFSLGIWGRPFLYESL